MENLGKALSSLSSWKPTGSLVPVIPAAQPFLWENLIEEGAQEIYSGLEPEKTEGPGKAMGK
jgi:hypothetical protein